MAEKKTIELEVKTNIDSAKSQFDSLSKSIDKTNKSASDLDATFEEVYGDLQPLTTRMGEAEDRLYELALAGKEATDEYKNLLNVVGNYRKTQIQTDLVVDAAATTLSQKMSGAVSGVAGAFSAAEGAMGLFGNESENVQKALLKVQSAMALSQGIESIVAAKSSFKQLGSVIKDVFTGIKGAIAASGIGLLLIALGTLYNYWDDIKGAVNGVSAEQEKLNVKVAKNLEIENDKLSKINDQDNVLKLQGKSEKEILELKIKQVDAVILATEAQIEQDKITKESQIAAAKRNHDYLKGFIDFITLPTKKLTEYFAKFVNMSSDVLAKIGIDIDKFDLKAIDEAFNKTNDKLASYIFDVGDTKAEADKVIKEHESTLTKLKNDRAGFQLAIQNINKEADKKEEERKKKKEEDDRIEAERRAMMAQGEIDADKAAYEYFAEQDRKEAERKEAARLKEMEDEQMLANFREGIRLQGIRNEEEAQAKKKLLRQQEIQFASDGFKLIGDFTELMGKRTDKERRRAFKIKKAADLASATIDGTKAVLSTYADTPGGPIIKGVAAGIAGAFSAIQIAKISKQQFEGGGSSDTGGGTNSSTPSTPSTSSGVIAPKFNVVGASANQLNTLQQQPIQAYVVSGDVTSAQSLDRNRIKNATL